MLAMELSSKRCSPCENGALPLDKSDIDYFLHQLHTDWEVVKGSILRKEFNFKSYMDVMVFVNDVAAIAEDENHHPDMQVGYKKVVVELTTHSIKGLSDNDFILARKIEMCC